MNYAILIGIPTLFFLIDSLVKTQARVFEKMGLLFLIIFSSLRVNVGVDYNTYENVFQSIKFGLNVTGFEPGFILLNKTVAFFGGSFHILLFCIAVIYMTCVYKAIEYASFSYRWLIFFVYLSYFNLYVYSLAAMRQSIAIGIFLISIRYINDKAPIKYVIAILIATMFHWTAGVMLIAYPFYHFIKSKKEITQFFVCSALIPLYLVCIGSVEKFAGYFNQKMTVYLITDKSDIPNSVSIALLYYVAMFVFILIWHVIVEKENNKKNSSVAKIGVLLFFTLKVMQSLHYLGALPRLEFYFYCLVPFALGELVEHIKSTKVRFMLTVVIVFVMVVQFVLAIQANSQYYGVFNIQ